MTTLYTTTFGSQILGDSLEVMQGIPSNSYDLILTSPPFALQRPKSYGNFCESDYIEWILPFFHEANRILKDSGSFVVDLGGAYMKGIPSRSIYQFRLLVACIDKVGFHLAQDLYWHNPAKLPSPIEWVNKRKIRVKDSVNNVWWLSKSPYPKADVTKVLTPYSERMKKLLKSPSTFYTAKVRPSGHDISETFSRDNGGSIPSSLLSIPNTESNSLYLRRCKELGAKPHPARFPSALPQFFINLLTDEGDTVLDIFSGSAVTGSVCEHSGRLWTCVEVDENFAKTSALRFAESSDAQDIMAEVDAFLADGSPDKTPPFLGSRLRF